MYSEKEKSELFKLNAIFPSLFNHCKLKLYQYCTTIYCKYYYYDLQAYFVLCSQ